jgi:hypothetical protein
MLASHTPKPATARNGEPASKIVGFGGRNDSIDTETPTNLQVRRLTRRFAFSLPVALVVAGLAYGGRS